MNKSVKLKGKPTPENWHIMATEHNYGFFVHWQHVKNEKPDKSEMMSSDEFNTKYEFL